MKNINNGFMTLFSLDALNISPAFISKHLSQEAFQQLFKEIHDYKVKICPKDLAFLFFF